MKETGTTLSRVSDLLGSPSESGKNNGPNRLKTTMKSEAVHQSNRNGSRPARVVFVPLVFELYDYICPTLRARQQQAFHQVCEELKIEHLELSCSELVSTLSHMRRLCKDLASQKVDLIVVTHLSYVPSGQIVSALQEIDTPVLLWPFQPMSQMVPKDFALRDVDVNHSVHGTMDLANMMRRAGRPCGVIHGHWQEAVFQRELCQWGQVGQVLQTLRDMKPLVIGERFPDMLDLRLDKEPFMQSMGIQPLQIPLATLLEEICQVSNPAAVELVESYRERFDVMPSLSGQVLLRSAKNELALRRLLENHQSRAVAINFIEVCKEPGIADALHLAASNLMAEGIGYGAEADWETASMIAAMQASLGADRVGFSEVFSVDYAKDRLLLRHWGEGNVAQSAGKPRLIKSEFNYLETKVEFPICDFQYRPTRHSLVNLNVTPDGKGQIVHIPGQVDDAPLPNCDGVKSLFRPDCPDVRETLNRYATLGGSHHFVLVEGDITQFAEKLAQQAGWCYHTIR